MRVVRAWLIQYHRMAPSWCLVLELDWPNTAGFGRTQIVRCVVDDFGNLVPVSPWV